MHRDALIHLRTADPALARVIDRIGECQLVPRTEGNHFDALVRAIVFQQLSGKAAGTIYGRVLDLYGGRPPTPEQLLATSDEALRTAGLSRGKTLYVKDLASRVVDGDVDIDALDAHEDEAIIEQLTRVKGIGRWSAQMFLLFRLGRPNVLPELDLGVQKGVQHAYGLARLPTPKDVLRIGARWTPYASIAAWYMWRLLELPDVVRDLAERRRRKPKKWPAGRKAAAKKSKRKAASTSRTARKPAKRAARRKTRRRR
jgi:DNA-3-methyladenine glycosylase II